jgi:osmotically-inducible protein OsmY
MIRSKLASVVVLAAVLSGSAYAQSAGESTDDAQIRAEVLRQIDDRSELKFDNISVRSVDHAVYLEGLVDTRVDQEEAATIAAAVPGVSKVYNELALSGNGG